MYNRQELEEEVERFVSKNKFSSIKENLDIFDGLMKNSEEKDITPSCKHELYVQAEAIIATIAGIVGRPVDRMSVRMKMLTPLRIKQSELKDVLKMTSEEHK